MVSRWVGFSQRFKVQGSVNINAHAQRACDCKNLFFWQDERKEATKEAAW